MLPAEPLADVVSFLGYYDLGGLKLASKRFSAVAHQCAQGIRLFDFSDLRFYIRRRCIYVRRYDESKRRSRRVRLELTSEENFTDVISAAFRNCIVGRFYIGWNCEHALNALKAVANTIVVDGTLGIYIETFGNVQELLEFVDGFRQVQRLEVMKFGRITPDEKTILETFCRRKNIGTSL